MGQIKKNQHYVWKEYLKPWCTKNKIFTFLKTSNKAILSNLTGVVNAIRNKLLLRIFAVLSDQRPYVENYQRVGA